METVLNDFNIPKNYIIPTSSTNRWEILTARSWIREITSTCSVPNFTTHDTLTSGEVYSRLKQNEHFEQPWLRLLISVIKKKHSSQIIALPQEHSPSTRPDHSKLSYSQTLHYVSVTNYKNLWKQSYKKYTNQCSTPCNLSTVDYNAGVRDILIRLYGCPIVVLGSPHLSCDSSEAYECHTNLLPALAVVETKSCFYIFQERRLLHSLQDAVDYSPALLCSNYTRSLFILYQLLNVMRDLHDRGLLQGDITLKDILVSNNLWIQVQPKITDNIYEVPASHAESKKPLPSPRPPTIDSSPNSNFDLDTLVKLWVEGALSNFDYIYSLNQLAGRKYGDPRNHFVFPWVTDFSGSDGSNWRDFSRSKFRLNKGDRQLDMTYESLLPGGISNQVPHHVSDILSEITYYVYLARQTPKEVLCTYVRPKWVPGEYPQSIQRLQEWTPDECIPEFFCDPGVFKSIHPDLPNLELPSWCHDADQFIAIHRAMLESQYVSERLHHWIDLTFGYKLSGTAAVKSKNVCLHLVDNHTHLTSTGLVPIFSTPHPQRLTSIPYFAKNPPRLTAINNTSKSPYEEDEYVHIDLEDEEVSTPPVSRPLVLSRFLSRSKNSLLGPSTSYQQHMSTSPSSDSIFSPPPPSDKSHLPTQIILPKDYNPALRLNSIENLYHFINRTCYRDMHSVRGEMDTEDTVGQDCVGNVTALDRLNLSASRSPQRSPNAEKMHRKVSKIDIQDRSQERDHSNSKNATNRAESREKGAECDTSDSMETSVRQIAKYRLKEMLVLGCLIVELFLNSKCKPFRSPDFEFDRRLRNCYAVLKNNWSSLPRCVAKVVRILFNYSDEIPIQDLSLDSFKYPPVNEFGLAPPSAHQLLIPTLTCFWFPASFEKIYSTLRTVAAYDGLVADIVDIKVNDPKLFDSKRSVLTSTQDQLNELRVRTLATCLASLAESQEFTSDQWLTVVVPYVQGMLEDKAVQLQAAWYLLDPVCRALGPRKSVEQFLPLVSKLYESLEPSDKRAKLYHRSFLLRLILRFGLGEFLEHFVVALVEAVGGCHDVTSSPEKKVTSLLSAVDTEGGRGLFSPMDEDSSAASEQTNTSVAESQPQDRHSSHSAEPEMFIMEESASDEPVDSSNHVEILLEQLEDQQWMNDDALDFEDDSSDQATPQGQGTPQGGLGVGASPRLKHKLKSTESVDVRRGDGCRVINEK